jgi:hypothetical protein
VDTVKLEEWYKLSKKLKDVRAKELALRKEVFASFFPVPVEGTNKVDLADGYTLKATYTIIRSVDEAALSAVLEKLGEGSRDRLIKVKVELNLRAYRKLSSPHQNIMDDALVIKPGSSSMEIVTPSGE